MLGWFVAAFVLVSAACLLVGFLTPIVATVAGIISAITAIASSLPFSTYSLVALIVPGGRYRLARPGRILNRFATIRPARDSYST